MPGNHDLGDKLSEVAQRKLLVTLRYLSTKKRLEKIIIVLSMPVFYLL